MDSLCFIQSGFFNGPLLLFVLMCQRQFVLLLIRVSSCDDFAPKWRFQRPSGARLSVAIRHPKGGNFGKLFEKAKKVVFF